MGHHSGNGPPAKLKAPFGPQQQSFACRPGPPSSATLRKKVAASALPPPPDAVDATIHIATGVMPHGSASNRIQQGSSDSAQELGDESFMSAAELRNYVTQTEMAKASKHVGSGQAENARAELIKSLMQPVAVTPEKIAEVKRRVLGQLRSAAVRGDKEVLVMRFPNALCTDKGRALNNLENEWPRNG